MRRRSFLARAALVGAALGLARVRAANFAAGGKRRPRILLRGSWQSVNIGDIAHTPGALRLFDQHFPEAEVTLWPGNLDYGARDMLLQAFPRLRIAEGGVDARDQPTTPALAQAWSEADVMVHGSSAGLGARRHVDAWHRATGRPYGVFGTTFDPVGGFGEGRLSEGATLDAAKARIARFPATHLNAEERATLDGAAFVFCRDSLSLDYLRRQKIKAPVLDFGPDATFAMHLRADARAADYLQAQGLQPRKFICVVPRLRFTPYASYYGAKRTPDDDIRDAINQRTTEPDHAKLRDLIVAWVRGTGLKVLACPEMTYQIETAKEFLVEPLPADVKPHVVWRDHYWLPDEAASIYAHAVAVISLECHSPIIALGAGTPAFDIRQPTASIKGHMYRDIGMSDWSFEIEETSGEQLWARLQTIRADPEKARRRVREVMNGVREIQARMVAAVRAAATARV